jgi:hypothetical protein
MSLLREVSTLDRCLYWRSVCIREALVCVRKMSVLIGELLVCVREVSVLERYLFVLQRCLD